MNKLLNIYYLFINKRLLLDNIYYLHFSYLL